MNKIISISRIIRYSLNAILCLIIIALTGLMLIFAGLNVCEEDGLRIYNFSLNGQENSEVSINMEFEIMHTKLSLEMLADNVVKITILISIFFIGLLSSFIYYNLTALFKLYETGKIFTLQNTVHIKKIAWGILILAISRILGSVIFWLVIRRFGEIGFNLTGLFPINLIITGLIAYSISLIMEEAQKLQEESDLVI